MNKPMAIYKQGSMEDQERYQDEIEKKMLKYLADPIELIFDNVLDFMPWTNAMTFEEAFRTEDLTELGRQLYRRMEQMAKQQATEDAEKGYE